MSAGEEEHLHVDLEGGCQEGAGGAAEPCGHGQACAPDPLTAAVRGQTCFCSCYGPEIWPGRQLECSHHKCELGLWAGLAQGRPGGARVSRGRSGPHLHQCRGGLSWGSQYPLPCIPHLAQVFISPVSVFSRSVVSDSATPWTAARQASLTNSRSPPKRRSVESVAPSSLSCQCAPPRSPAHSAAAPSYGQCLGRGQSGLSRHPRSDKCLPGVGRAPGLREPGHHRHRTHGCCPARARPAGRRLWCAPVTSASCSRAQVVLPAEKGPGPVTWDPSHLPSGSSQAPPGAVLAAWGGSGKGCAVGSDVHDRAAGPAVVDSAGRWARGQAAGARPSRTGRAAGRGGCMADVHDWGQPGG